MWGEKGHREQLFLPVETEACQHIIFLADEIIYLITFLPPTKCSPSVTLFWKRNQIWRNIVLINLRSKLWWKDRLLVRLAKLKTCSLGLKDSLLSDFVFSPHCFQVEGNLGSVGITSRVQLFTINFIKCSDTHRHTERFKAMQKQFNCKERERQRRKNSVLKLLSVLFVIISFAFQIIFVWIELLFLELT